MIWRYTIFFNDAHGDWHGFRHFTGVRPSWPVGGATEPGRSSQPWATLREELRKETVPLFQSPDLYCTMKLLEENFGGHFWGKTRWFCFIEKQPYSILQWQHLSFDMSQRDIVSSNLGQHCRWAKACGRGESSVAVAAVTTCSSFVMSCRSDPWDPQTEYCDAQLPQEWWIFSFLFGGQAMVGPSCLSLMSASCWTLRSRPDWVLKAWAESPEPDVFSTFLGKRAGSKTGIEHF